MTTALPSPLSNFHPFPNLPAELRLRIWRLAIFTPRDIHICSSTLQSTWEDVLHSTSYIPSLLHSSHEARSEGLQHYVPVFLCYNYAPTHRAIPFSWNSPDVIENDVLDDVDFRPTTPRIYMHPELDRLVLMPESVTSYEAMERVEHVLHAYRVRRVAMAYQVYNQPMVSQYSLARWAGSDWFAVREFGLFEVKDKDLLAASKGNGTLVETDPSAALEGVQSMMLTVKGTMGFMWANLLLAYCSKRSGEVGREAALTEEQISSPRVFKILLFARGSV